MSQRRWSFDLELELIREGYEGDYDIVRRHVAGKEAFIQHVRVPENL